MMGKNINEKTIPIKILDCTEVDSLKSLVDEFVSSHRGLAFRPDYWTGFCDWMKQLSADSNAIVYTAQTGATIVGFGVGTIQIKWSMLSPDRTGYIGMLVVSPDYRRKKIGQQLWDALRDWFSKKGVEEIQLYTQVNNSVSQSFWRHYGFEVMLELRKRSIE